MALPTALKRQLAEADAMMAKLRGEGESPAGEPGQAPVEEPGQAPVEEPAQQAQSAAPAEDPAQLWEQRYRSLQGRYNADMQRWAQERAAPQPPAPAPAAPVSVDTLAKSLVSEAEMTEYGEDFAQFVARVAAKAAVQQTEHLKPVIEQVRGQVVQTQADTARGAIYTALNANVPEWQTINTSPAFTGWLANEDGFSGKTRHEVLTEAFQRGDVGRVLNIFKAFTGTNGVASSAPAKNGKVPLQELAGPRSTAPVGPRTPEQPQEVTEGEIREFYAMKRKGVLTAKQITDTEAEIAAALREGRVRPDRIQTNMTR